MKQDYEAIRFHEYGSSDKLLLETIAGQVSEEKAKSHGIKAVSSGRGHVLLKAK